MHHHKVRWLLFAIAFHSVLTWPAHAANLFTMDFEGFDLKTISAPRPSWSLPASFANLYGPNNHFEVTTSSAHSGTASLRFTYTGRNGYCNTCGSNLVRQKLGLDGVNYLVASAGENLALEPYNAKAGRLVFNISNGHSMWEVLAVSNKNAVKDQLSLKLLKAGVNGEKTFNANDKVAIARQCGVDGTAAKSGGEFLVNRRIDCDAVIGWLNVPTAQLSGQSIFRRVYVKADVTSPVIHQKLRYWRLPGIADYFGPGEDLRKDNIILLADANNGPLQPNISGLGTYGGLFHAPGNGNGMPADTKFERDVWYYIEEEFKAESTPGAADGVYRLWFSKSGEEATVGATPLIQHTNLTLPPIVSGTNSASLWGNVQHSSHSIGTWFIDDLVIATKKVGPAIGGGSNLLPPRPPTTN